MAKYFYTALKDNKVIIKGEIDAVDSREARSKIRNLGYLPTKVYMEENAVNEAVVSQRIDFKGKKRVKRLSLQEKIMFTSELQVLLSSGIPIIEALDIISNNTPKIKLKLICDDIKHSIVEGMTFAEAVTKYYLEVFGSIFTGLIQTGETSGELDVTLERMLFLLKKQDNIKGKIINASIYPCVLILMMLGLLVLFSKFVFPIFIGVMDFNGQDIPFLADMLFGFCKFIDQFWWFVLIIASGSIYFLSTVFKNSTVKKVIDNFVLKIPSLSEFIQYINLANFMNVLQISYDAGVPIIGALNLSAKTIGNNTIREKVDKSISYVTQGRGLAQSFEFTGAIPGPILMMIATGEMSGNLGKMLKDAADVIDKKVDMALEVLTRLFEPAVILIMGGVVLFIALAFFQFYTGMIGSFI